MKEYLQFVWNSLIHPTNFVDFLPAFQLVLFILFIYCMFRAFLSIIQDAKEDRFY
jgi:hypothetical protein